MILGDRKKEILRTVIDRYIETAEPVGSKSISSALSLSPATIRNEMAELESFGLLEQTHPSAGRVPTAAGYRVYVDELMRRHRLSANETEELNRALRIRLEELDGIIAYAGKIASRLTGFPAYSLAVTRPGDVITRFDIIGTDARSFIVVALTSGDAVRNKLVRMPENLPDGILTRAAALFNAGFTNITEAAVTNALLETTARAMGDTVGLTAVLAQFVLEILSENAGADFTVAGSARLFDHPEFRAVEKARRVLKYLSGDETLPALPAPESGSRAKITIGPENLADELRDSSVVVTRYEMGDGADLLIGIVGPTRMDYSRVLSQLRYLSLGLTNAPPEDVTDGGGGIS